MTKIVGTKISGGGLTRRTMLKGAAATGERSDLMCGFAGVLRSGSAGGAQRQSGVLALEIQALKDFELYLVGILKLVDHRHRKT